MKICVYAICKNEISFINKWYDSVKEADYVCLLDTGSTDGTYEVVKNLSLIHRQETIEPWSFGKARALSFSLIPEDTDYCLFVDLDECLEVGWRDKLEQFLIENSCEVAEVVNIDLIDGMVSHRGSKVIICRYNSMLEWRYSILEELFYDGLPLFKYKGTHNRILNTNILLYHTRIDKTSRNAYTELNSLRIEEILLDLNKEKDDIRRLYLCYSMLDSFMNQNQIDKSIIPHAYVKRLIGILNGINMSILNTAEQINLYWCLFYYHLYIDDVSNAECISKRFIFYATSRLVESLFMLFDYYLHHEDTNKAYFYGDKVVRILNGLTIKSLNETNQILDFFKAYSHICSIEDKNMINAMISKMVSIVKGQTLFNEFIISI